MSKPLQIVWFERLYMASISLDCLMGLDAFLRPIHLAELVISITLVILVSIRASDTAKWTLVVLTVLGLPVPLLVLVVHTGWQPAFLIGFLVDAIQTLAEAIAVTLLFTPGARIWFREMRARRDLRRASSAT